MIIGASDQMLTAGDIEFEPPLANEYLFGPRWSVGLLAGDTTTQAAICSWTRARLTATPPASVEEIANTYAEELANYRRRFVEFSRLRPIGHTVVSFLANQRDFDPAFVSDVLNALATEAVDASAIITGIDSFGAHIFVVYEPGIAFCNDNVGFAAIGTGRRHAESHFMLSRYHRNASISTALMVVHRAKKRAEVSPHVGEATDMFVIGVQGFDWVDPELRNQVAELFRKTESTIDIAISGETEIATAMVSDFLARKATS